MSRTEDLARARLRVRPAAQVGDAPSDRSRDRTASGESGEPDPPPTPAGSAGEDHRVGDARRPARGPRAPLPPGVRLLGLLVVVALALAGWMLVRAWPRTEVQVPGPGVGPPGSGPELAGEPSPAPTGIHPLLGTPAADRPPAGPSAVPQAQSLVVHVAGDVRRPGVVVLPEGSRVGDAVAAAGGLRRGGSVGSANLARPLVDGERVEIGPGATDSGAVAGSGAGAARPSGPVDLNVATAAQLDALPGIGPVTAAKILAWRAEHGRFTVVDELTEIPGIGPRTLEELRAHVRV